MLSYKFFVVFLKNYPNLKKTRLGSPLSWQSVDSSTLSDPGKGAAAAEPRSPERPAEGPFPGGSVRCKIQLAERRHS